MKPTQEQVRRAAKAMMPELEWEKRDDDGQVINPYLHRAQNETLVKARLALESLQAPNNDDVWCGVCAGSGRVPSVTGDMYECSSCEGVGTQISQQCVSAYRTGAKAALRSLASDIKNSATPRRLPRFHSHDLRA